MKKIIFFASAVAAMFAASSCQKEIEYLDGDTKVTFEVSAGDLATKAIADASNITVLHWELYGADVRTAAAPYGEGKVEDQDGDKKFTVELRLVADQDYNIVFWAETADGATHYVTDDLRSVKIKTYTDESANDESRAAFFGVHSFHTENGVAVNEQVTLYRPFSQINLGTTTYDTSLNLVDGGKVIVNSTEMTVTTLANSFNTLDGVGESDSAFDGVVTFAAAATPNGDADKTQQLLAVNEDTYYWIGMNYLIVEGNSDNVKVDVTLNTNMGVVKHSIDNVPVKENYRTNIIGDFITTGAKFEIVVDERFEQPDYEIIYGVPEEPAYNAETKTWSIVKAANVLWLAAQPKGFAAGQKISFDADIDMMGQGIAPIIASTATENSTQVLGNGHKVYNFVVNKLGRNSAGLFGDHHGNITDLHVENVTVCGEYKAAALVGSIYGSVVNCSAKNVKVLSVPYSEAGNYDGGNHVGALIGYAAESGKTAYAHTGNVVDGAEVKAYRDVAGLIGTVQSGVAVENNQVKNVKVVLDQVTNFYGNETPNAGKVGGRVFASATLSNNTVENVLIETLLPEWTNVNGVKTLPLVGNTYLYDGQQLCDTRAYAEDYVIDGKGATVKFVADDADDLTAFTTFTSTAKNNVVVKNISFTGEYWFMAAGYHWEAKSSEKEKQYFTTFENVNIIDAKVMPVQIAQALFCDGVTVLNDCNIYGTQLSSYSASTVAVYDIATFNYSHTTLNGGKYGVVGCTKGWPQSTLVINRAEIDTVENYYLARPYAATRPDAETRGLYINAGSKINTVNTYGGTSSWTQLHIAEGAQVETLVFDANALTNPKFTSEWIKIADGTVNKVIANGTEMTLKEFKTAYNL